MKFSMMRRIVSVTAIVALSWAGTSTLAWAGENPQPQQTRKKQKVKKRTVVKKKQTQAVQNQQWQRDRDWTRHVQQRGKKVQTQQQQIRLSQEHQQRLILENQQRRKRYGQILDRRGNYIQYKSSLLQKQKRMTHYRYQQEYIRRMNAQRALQRNRRLDYANDPYFQTGWNYRYFRNGRYYQTNRYGANLLREAMHHGYEQGFLAGEADRQDRWRFDYQGSYAYQDANYGYGGYYVSQSEYNHYFREGFRRGYEGRRSFGAAGGIAMIASTIASIRSSCLPNG